MPPKSVHILPGITIDGIGGIAQEHGVPIEVRPVPAAELRAADEIWLSSSGREVLAVVSLDGVPVGSGKPGPMYRSMHKWFQQAKLVDAERWASRVKTSRVHHSPTTEARTDK